MMALLMSLQATMIAMGKKIGFETVGIEPTLTVPRVGQTGDPQAMDTSRPRESNPGPDRGPRNEAPTSSNPDFALICKGLFRFVQLSHHRTNWTSLPQSIGRAISKITDNIRPPMPTSTLTDELAALSMDYSQKITRAVQRHIDQSKVSTEQDLLKLSPQDLSAAVSVANKQLVSKLGKRIAATTQKRLLEEASAMVGLGRTTSCADRQVQTPSVAATDMPDDQRETTSCTTRQVQTPSVAATDMPDDQRKTTSCTARQVQAPSVDLQEDSNPGERPPRALSSTGLILIDSISGSEESEDEEPPGNLTGPVRPISPLISGTPGKRPRDQGLSPETVSPTESNPYGSPRRKGLPCPKRYKTVNTVHRKMDADPNTVHINRDCRVLILGDSQVKNLTPLPACFQIESFSGAGLEWMTDVIKGLDLPDHVEDIVLAAGFNHRTLDFDRRTAPSFVTCLEVLRRTRKRIHFLGINTPHTLPTFEANTIRRINALARDKFEDRYIETLPGSTVSTAADGIHYSAAALKRIADKINSHFSLN